MRYVTMNLYNMTIHVGCTGYSVNLTKENTVHSGHFDLVLEVTDRLGEHTFLNLSVTVCNCLNTARPNCRIRKATGSTVGGGALGTIFFGILLLAGRTHVQNTSFVISL